MFLHTIMEHILVLVQVDVQFLLINRLIILLVALLILLLLLKEIVNVHQVPLNIIKPILILLTPNKIKILVLILCLLFVLQLVLLGQHFQIMYVLAWAHILLLFKMEQCLVFVMHNKDWLNNLLETVYTHVVLLIQLEINMEFVLVIQDTFQLETFIKMFH